MAEPREGGPTAENRWWVDIGKTTEPAKVVPKGDRPPVGSKFFDIGCEFDQEQAKQRLTDLNLRFFDEGRPEPNEWRLIRMVPNESVPAYPIKRMKRRLPLPPGVRGVIVDSGRSVRFIIAGDPVGERVLSQSRRRAPQCATIRLALPRARASSQQRHESMMRKEGVTT